MNAFAAAAKSTPAAASDPGVIRRALAWMGRQSAEGRAEAVNALARAYLHSSLPDAMRAEAMLALTSALDDSSVQVRRALAEAFAGASDAPRHIVLALASDRSEVARIVLARSPLFEDGELVDCAAIGDAAVQAAIARRPRLGPGVAAAIAEIGEKSAVVALAGNLDAKLGPNVLRRIFERFGDDAQLREVLLARDYLPAGLRADLAAATAHALAEFAASRLWLDPRRAERIARDAREQAVVTIAAESQKEELPELVGRLRESRSLTVALLMRALLSGDVGLFATTLTQMSAAPPHRVAGFLANWRGQGFAALYAKAGLPGHLLPAFRAALAALEREPEILGDRISHALTMRVIHDCEALREPSLAPVISMLWRFAAESARDDARGFAADVALAAELAPVRAAEFEASAAPAPAIALEFEGANENFAPVVEIEAETLEEAPAYEPVEDAEIVDEAA